MAWNQPGGSDNNPWGRKPSRDGQNVDEAFRNFQRKLEQLLKGGGGGGDGGSESSGGDGRSTLLLVLVIAFIAWSYMCFFQVEQAERAVVERGFALLWIKVTNITNHFICLQKERGRKRDCLARPQIAACRHWGLEPDPRRTL